MTEENWCDILKWIHPQLSGKAWSIILFVIYNFSYYIYLLVDKTVHFGFFPVPMKWGSEFHKNEEINVEWLGFRACVEWTIVTGMGRALDNVEVTDSVAI